MILALALVGAAQDEDELLLDDDVLLEEAAPDAPLSQVPS